MITGADLIKAGYTRTSNYLTNPDEKAIFQKKVGHKYFITFHHYDFPKNIPASICDMSCEVCFRRNLGEDTFWITISCQRKTVEEVEAIVEEIFVKLGIDNY